MDPDDDLIGQPLDEVPQQDPTDERCMGKKKQKSGGEVVRDDDGNALFGGYCGSWPGKETDHLGEGRCSRHGGLNSGENGQGGTENNRNAVTHGAYAKHATQTLTEGEEEAFDEVADALDDPTDAQEVARNAASYCLMMGHRAGDDRWFRRFEGICDKFELAPEEVQRHEHEHEHDGSLAVDHEHALEEETQRRIGDLFDAMGNDE